jgi:hypothetical protein
MGKNNMNQQLPVILFNGAVEMGLRCLAILNEAFPSAYSLQKLVVFDYLTVHSDDAPGGPTGLHPQTPNRGGEILIRRDKLREGLMLYQSRGLIEQRFEQSGLYFVATDRSGGFLDALDAEYVEFLRLRAGWVIDRFGGLSDKDLGEFVHEHIESWGAEFEWSSVLWAEEYA